ncbi:MAG: hypothetical protein ACKV19_19200 [Verrucomicrobiales bacterium]
MAALPCGESGGGELLDVAATFDERLFHRRNLAIEQEIRLMDQTDGGIGADGRVSVFQPRSVQTPALLISQISQIRLISLKLPRHIANRSRFVASQPPLGQVAVAQEILEIE